MLIKGGTDLDEESFVYTNSLRKHFMIKMYLQNCQVSYT